MCHQWWEVVRPMLGGKWIGFVEDVGSVGVGDHQVVREAVAWRALIASNEKKEKEGQNDIREKK